ncbi:hypothetical protein CHS0354_020077 [Potamilus streckersoni]|uniref:Gamma-tubulin complex component n=1 Tax=Potamilus streckersoni TaxID=2493646 RepID=A0AAE0VT91_9BIVA|nr:hypothetical protein CHS0354_020077 [Potamilus streckersoni]
MARWKGSFEQDLKKLIKLITGFEDNDENFHLCVNFSTSNIKHHKFLDVDSHKVMRSVEGICEKLRIHNEIKNAEKLEKYVDLFLQIPAFEGKDIGKTDTHYALLALLLNLAESPVFAEYKEIIKEVEETKDEFDWRAYLLEGEEIYIPSDGDTTDEEWTDEYKNMDGPSGEKIAVLKFEDDRIKEETSVTELLESNLLSQDLSTPAESGYSWLINNVVIQYWQGMIDDNQEIGDYPSSNLSIDWERYQERTNPLYSAGNMSLLTEIQLMREIIWMFSGVSSLFVFQFDGMQFKTRNDIMMSHLTTNSLQSILEDFAKYGTYVQVLYKCVQKVVSLSFCGNSQSAETVGQTYQAFANAITQFLLKMKVDMGKMEKRLIAEEETITMSLLYDELKPWLRKVVTLHEVYVKGIKRGYGFPSNSQRASKLLSAIYEKVMEYDTMGQYAGELLGLLLPIWLQTSRPYIDIIDSWITYGTLVDPKEEFVITRNREVKSLDETFWERAFTLHASASNNNANEDSNSVQKTNNSCAQMSRRVWAPLFLQPILLQVILTGKSMEMLESLGKLYDVVDKQDGLTSKQESLYEKFVNSLQALLCTKRVEEAVNSIQAVATPSKFVMFSVQVEQQMKLKGVYDPLLRINFETLFLDWIKKSEGKQSEEDDVSRILDLLDTENLQPVELILQQCLYPLIIKRYHKVCTHLVRILKEDYNLMEYLAAMRNFFLMEAGDTMFSFYTQLFDKIRRHEPWRDVSTVNMLLQESLSAHFPEEVNRLSVDVVIQDGMKDGQPTSITDCLKLHYKVPWPVDVVINSHCLELYNQIFSFLLQVKRVKYCLDELRFKDLEKENILRSLSHEKDLEATSEPGEIPRASRVHRMQILRMRLIYFVNSLHNYVMTRILHSTGLEFVCDLEKAVDLDQLIMVHNNYVRKIHERCLLHKKVGFLKEAVMKVLNLSLHFQRKWDQGIDEVMLKTIQDMESEFTRCIQFLASFLSNIIKRGSFPHLESLAFSLVTSTEHLTAFI